MKNSFGITSIVTQKLLTKCRRQADTVHCPTQTNPKN